MLILYILFINITGHTRIIISIVSILVCMALPILVNIVNIGVRGILSNLLRGCMKKKTHVLTCMQSFQLQYTGKYK